MTCPSLTTIGQPIGKMATKAVDMLLKEIELKDQCVTENVRMEPELVIRESTSRCSV